MAFNAEKFKAAEFAARTETVEIAKMQEFFDDGEKPEFVVRGLSAHELQRAIDAGARQGGLDSVVKAIASKGEQVEAIRKALGMTKDTPGEIAKRLEMLVLGSVSPQLDSAAAAKLAEVCPVEFYDLTNKITMLTGQGGNRVKQQPSSRRRQAS